jgi:hypothetical protein
METSGWLRHAALARPDDESVSMNMSAVKRVQQSDGAVVLSSNQTSVFIKRPSPSVLVLVICGAAARDIGAPMFDEIRTAFHPGRKLTLFIDLQQAAGSTMTVEAWVKFLRDNLQSFSRVVILALSKATSLTANVIDHFVRQDKLFEILDDSAAFQSRLAQAASQARPLP